MQKAKDKNFKDRSVFHIANLIQNQGSSVSDNRSYELPEVYFVAIMTFKLDDSHPDHYMQD